MTKNRLTTIILNAITPTFGMMIIVSNMLDAHDSEGIALRLLSKFLFSLAISIVLTSLVFEINTLKDELRNLKQGQTGTDTRD